MIKPSAEIAAIAKRWGDAIGRRDEATLRNLLSTSEHLSYVGSAEGELWTGQVLRDGIGDHFREVPDFEEGAEHMKAFECGPVGWAYSFTPLRFAGSDHFVVHRITYVFVLEDGVWKIAHVHLSNPMPNMEKMGIENRALDALMAAARDDFDSIGTTGIASVMFTDIADSSSMADLVGDRVWMRAIRAHLDAVGAEITRVGGTLVKSLGDGTMSTFPSALAALTAARAVQRLATAPTDGLPLRVRVGIHTGDVIRSEDDFFGTVVNKAARIAGLADADEIRVSDATCALLGSADDFAFNDPAEVTLKGLEGTHLVHRLIY